MWRLRFETALGMPLKVVLLGGAGDGALLDGQGRQDVLAMTFRLKPEDDRA